MKVYFLCIIVFLCITEALTHVVQEQSNTRSFLVKTKLNKEQLETLLHQSEVQSTNLKKSEQSEKDEENKNNLNTTNTTNTSTVEEVDDAYESDEELQKEIEDEIMEDALKPLDEFHVKEVKTSEVKTFVAKANDVTLLDFLYEKKFGKIYAYLSLLLVIFVFIYFKDVFNNKKEYIEKKKYINYYDFDLSRESMIEKNN